MSRVLPRRVLRAAVLAILILLCLTNIAAAAPPGQGITPRTDLPSGVKLLAGFLGAFLTGGGVYKAADWLFRYGEDWGIRLTARQKRAAIFPLCAAVALGGLGLGIWLGIYDASPDNFLLATFAIFAASQAFHARDLGKKAA